MLASRWQCRLQGVHSALQLPPAAAMSSAAGAEQQLRLAPARTLSPADVQMGCIWLGPHPGLPDSLNQNRGQENANELVAAALEAGITQFDTAPLYGFGASEERLGAALAAAGASGDAEIYTKIGRLIREPDGSGPCAVGFEQPGATPPEDRSITNDYTAAGVTTSLAESLERLRVDGVHTLRIHDPNDNDTRDGSDEIVTATSAGGAVEQLVAMRESGTLTHVSLGMNSNDEEHQGVPTEIVRLIQSAPTGSFDSALLAGGWNLLTQAGLPCMLECQRSGVAVHVAGVFNTGLLVGGDTYAYQPAEESMVAKARAWGELAEAHGVSLPAVALAFCALPECVERLVIGIATIEELEQNLAALEEANRVPAQLWSEAQAVGLLPPEIPSPRREIHVM